MTCFSDYDTLPKAQELKWRPPNRRALVTRTPAKRRPEFLEAALYCPKTEVPSSLGIDIHGWKPLEGPCKTSSLETLGHMEHRHRCLWATLKYSSWSLRVTLKHRSWSPWANWSIELGACGDSRCSAGISSCQVSSWVFGLTPRTLRDLVRRRGSVFSCVHFGSVFMGSRGPMSQISKYNTAVVLFC